MTQSSGEQRQLGFVQDRYGMACFGGQNDGSLKENTFTEHGGGSNYLKSQIRTSESRIGGSKPSKSSAASINADSDHEPYPSHPKVQVIVSDVNSDGHETDAMFNHLRKWDNFN